MASAAASQRVHGTVRDSHDPNDELILHSSAEIRAAKSTNSVDLRRNRDIPVYNQRSMESCSANAMCSAYRFSRDNSDEPSRLFLYYNSRFIEHSVDEDAGVTSIRDCIRALDNYGICREDQWPYLKTELFIKPSERCYSSARRRRDSVKGCVYGERLLRHHSRRPQMRSSDIHQLKACLHQGSPFVFGFDVHNNFDQWDGKGVMPHPRGRLKGGHAVMAVGYNDSLGDKGCVIVLNSWGTTWGKRGFFYMPYDIIVDPNYCFDFWKVSFDD